MILMQVSYPSDSHFFSIRTRVSERENNMFLDTSKHLKLICIHIPYELRWLFQGRQRRQVVRVGHNAGRQLCE